jgi:hypothetical protein
MQTLHFAQLKNEYRDLHQNSKKLYFLDISEIAVKFTTLSDFSTKFVIDSGTTES